MRPVNLIPADERRGDRQMRTGAFSYVLIGGLAVALLAVVVLAMTSKQISDKKSEVAQLQQEEQQVSARAQSLQAFADFRAMQEARSATVTSLAQSRFDWQRVLEEFARVIPANVSLLQLAGTVNPTVKPQNDPSIEIRGSIPGPALEIVGCASNQDDVASLISNLEEIDGVTRVGMQSSERPDDESAGTATEAGTTADSASGTPDDCPMNLLTFKVVAAFDAVPAPATATSTPSVPSSLAGSGSALTSQSTSSSGGE